MSLTFEALRLANKLRLPQFRNKQGAAAHSKVDGSDWTVAQWFRAWLGEIGEFAEVRTDFERGAINHQEYRVAAAKELADAATYQDLLALRALDETTESETSDDAQLLMLAVAHLGRYANQAKKFDRGEITGEVLREFADQELLRAMDAIRMLRNIGDAPRSATARTDPHGINLGASVAAKFNEVSTRVGCNVFITQAGDVCVDARRVGP